MFNNAIGCNPILDAMMNSSRARPTPSFGRNETSNALSATATFTITFVFVFGIFLRSCSTTLNFNAPL